MSSNGTRHHPWQSTCWAVRCRPEPWQVHLGEPVDDRPLDKATRTRAANAGAGATDRSRGGVHPARSRRQPARKRSRDSATGLRACTTGACGRQPGLIDPHNDETPGQVSPDAKELRDEMGCSMVNYPECARGDLNPHARKDTAT